MSEEVIDKTTYDGLSEMVGEDFMGELVETFFEESPGILDEMRLALDKGDAEAFRRLAHSLKSNGASFGATQLASKAHELEVMGCDNQLEEAGPEMAQVEAAYEQAAEALKALL